MEETVNTTNPVFGDLHPAEHVAQSPEGHHGDRLHQAVAHDHPEEIHDVARSQRIQMDAPEDGREGDDDDRPVERGHEHRRGGVDQGDPAVVVIDLR
jgi:hypothetical protein